MGVVILAIDPGKESGWGILHDGKVLEFGECTSAEERAAVCIAAKNLAAVFNGHLLVVMECWVPGGWPSFKGIVGMGAQRGRWQEALELAGIEHIDDVVPQTWRAAVIGGPQRKSEAWKKAAQDVVKKRYGVDAGVNAADALCIGTYYAGSSKCADRLSKLERRSKRAATRATKDRSSSIKRPVRRNAKVGV